MKCRSPKGGLPEEVPLCPSCPVTVGPKHRPVKVGRHIRAIGRAAHYDQVAYDDIGHTAALRDAFFSPLVSLPSAHCAPLALYKGTLVESRASAMVPLVMAEAFSAVS